MAKNTVTEDDLLAGVGGLGSFNTLGSGKPVRGNPFRDTRREAPAVQPAPEKKTAQTPVSVIPTQLAAQGQVAEVSTSVANSRPEPQPSGIMKMILNPQYTS